MTALSTACMAFLLSLSPSLLQAGETRLETPDTFVSFTALAFSPDGRFLAGSRDGGEGLVLWNPKTGKISASLKGKAGLTLKWLAFSDDGKSLCGVDPDAGTAALWDMRSGRLLRVVSMGGKLFQHGGLLRLALSGNGRMLAAVREKVKTIEKYDFKLSGELTVWDVRTGRAKWKLPESNVQALAFSPDGKTLAAYTATPTDFKVNSAGTGATWRQKDRKLQLWAAGTGKPGRSNSVEGRVPYCLAFAHNGKKLAGINFGVLQLWDAENLKPSGGFEWADSRRVFNSFRFSRDGNKLARASLDWADVTDLETGKADVALTSKFPNFWSKNAFSPDLKRMACDRKGYIILDLAPGK